MRLDEKSLYTGPANKNLAVDSSILRLDCRIDYTGLKFCRQDVAVGRTDLPGWLEFFQNRLFEVIRQAIVIIVGAGEACDLRSKGHREQDPKTYEDKLTKVS